MRRSIVLSGGIAALLGILSMARPSIATDDGYQLQTEQRKVADSSYRVLTDQEKQALELQILSRFVPHAERYWRSSDIPEPNTGRYESAGTGVTQPRGAGQLAFAYATLLTALPRQSSFGGVSRATMLDHTIKSIRHTALTNKLSGAGHDRWGGGTTQASLVTYTFGFAAYLLWDHLDEETKVLARKVISAEADILLTKPIGNGEKGDTKAEENGWNAPTPALAAALSPQDPRAPKWRERAIVLALNASSTSADAESDQIVESRPVKDRISSVNLYPDLTMENHGFFNPLYQQVTHVSVGDAAIIEAVAGHAPPQVGFRAQEVWEGILGPLASDDGDLVMPAGQDWISKDYQHLGYLSVLATRFRRPDASVLESRALLTIARRQAAQPDGSLLGQSELGYETMLVKRIAGSWWNHRVFGPSPTPSEEEFRDDRDATSGTHVYGDVEVVQGRFDGTTVTMSWNPVRPMGLVVPPATGHLDDPVFTYYRPGSLIGAAKGAGKHACDCRPDRFSTAGLIGTRMFSMTAFPDGMTMLLDRGTGSTFSYSLERIPGVAENRPIYSVGGEGSGALRGSWVNLADRLGMVVMGGSGIRARTVDGRNNSLLVTGSTDTGTGNRGAALFPGNDHATTAKLAAHVSQPAVPDGWSALMARADDGTSRLAVARWSGAGSATLRLKEPRGGPLTAAQSRITGDVTTASFTLNAPASTGDILRFFVRTDVSVLARQQGEHTAILTNPGSTPATVRVTYAAGDGRQLVARHLIAPGERITARVVDGDLVLTSSRYEALGYALTVLAKLTGGVTRLVGDER
ncbi:hypothetical protein [Actinopolymorpha alba]|uniref:hypothetical protein n=1 Tax=Actinopolymorpha alba TaxID=533267 RepID=UPI000376629F|nr:hypothetical protein [Actinopolymorpha alba]